MAISNKELYARLRSPKENHRVPIHFRYANVIYVMNQKGVHIGTCPSCHGVRGWLHIKTFEVFVDGLYYCSLSTCSYQGIITSFLLGISCDNIANSEGYSMQETGSHWNAIQITFSLFKYACYSGMTRLTAMSIQLVPTRWWLSSPTQASKLGR